MVMDAFKPFFKREILSMATRKISKMLQHNINTIVFSQPTLIPVANNPPMSLNYTMISQPYLINHDHMAFSFDGHLLDTRNLNRHEPQTFPIKTLSYLCKNRNSLKILVTEQALNTAIRTLHAQRVIEFNEMPRVPSFLIHSLSPSFKMVFGKDT